MSETRPDDPRTDRPDDVVPAPPNDHPFSDPDEVVENDHPLSDPAEDGSAHEPDRGSDAP